ncbi:unnamed protein product [Symbiodinium natans]|uniref:Uncharacterized protein n=1 Tax=Symbiodinium natans TaxID=878477 RepID=A0A812UQC6_9DINO|nr:unnamed protein product [Symbiodinium natans]
MFEYTLEALHICVWDAYDWVFGKSEREEWLEKRVEGLESAVATLQELMQDVAENLTRAADRSELQAAETRVMNAIQAAIAMRQAPAVSSGKSRSAECTTAKSFGKGVAVFGSSRACKVYSPYVQPTTPDPWGRF